MQKHWNLFLLVVFLVLSIVIIRMGSNYKASQTSSQQERIYNKLAFSLSNKFETLIEEKKNATLTIGLALAHNMHFHTISEDKKSLQELLSILSRELRSETDFKNVWIQLVDKDGVVLSRSWTDNAGDRIYDKTEIFNLKKVTTTLDVDKYDFSFKVSVPLFDNEIFIGALEVITHFNSIAQKIKDEGFEPLILLDKRYKKHLEFPFTNTFIKDYYVVNKDIDQELLEYIKRVNIEEEIDYKTHYSIDKDGKYFKVYYTIFDSNEKPMAYSIMYKKVKHIDIESIENNNYMINLFIVFSIIVLLLLVLLFLAKVNSEGEVKASTFKNLLIFLSIFVSISLIYYLLLTWYQGSERIKYLNSYNNNIEKDYLIIQNKFQAIAETMFETTLRDTKVSELVKQAYGEDKDKAREKLYSLLKDRYDFFKQYDLRQLHFHLKNNESFLRFHRPQKYGDNLTTVRETVAWVNINHKRISGFEEGRIFNGFRHVFPLSLDDAEGQPEHIGSVETSFSAHAIAHEFAISHNGSVGFIIHKDVVDTKVFNSEQSNYEPSELDSFYYEKIIKKQFEYDFRHFSIDKIDKKELKYIDEKILVGEVFSLESKDTTSLFTFFPIKNALTGKTVASIVLQMNNEVLEKQHHFFILLWSVGTFLIFFVVMFIFREEQLKGKFFDLSKKTQHILDAQSSIVIITNGKKVIEVNKKFLQFFGYETLEEFKMNYDCICEHFIENENYYHLGKVPESTIWIDYLESIPAKNRVVLIKDKEGEDHSFGVSVSHYKHEYNIVTFTDISGTIEEQFMLEKKVFHDLLTGAYNREFFDNNIQKIIEDMTTQGKFLGLMFFDIDHFKSINDIYGHNIGDDILKELVRTVIDSTRDGDYLVRWGGEEFIVLSVTKSLEEITRMAEHLRSRISHYEFEEVGKVTCSFGVTLHLATEDISHTIRRADEAMYTSKHEGRNRVTAV